VGSGHTQFVPKEPSPGKGLQEARAFDSPGDLATRFLDELQSGRSEHDEALEELWNLCNADPATRFVLEKHELDQKSFVDLYWGLLAGGAGQWARRHYVAASAMAFGFTLDYAIRNRDAIPRTELAIRLINYFRNGEVGPLV
jgi:hypothetical protein